jgi:predicted kinase
MHFILLYGRPAVGKLTVGRELAQLTSYPLFHNHLIVDAVLAVHPFGSAGFTAMRDALWRTAFTEIAKDTDLPGLISTFNLERSVPQAFIDELFAQFADAGHDIRVFELTCDEAEIERRIAAPTRSENQKLTDVDLYRRLRAEGFFSTPTITHNRTIFDTSDRTPAETARLIHEHLG